MAKTPHSITLHATCVSIAGKGLLLLGESGSGKSDMALRLIHDGATLIGDDQIVITKRDDHLLASPAPNIHGMIEARGIGILHLPFVRDIPLKLAVELVTCDKVERMPPVKFWGCLGLQLSLLSLNAFDSSILAKINLYMQTL